jgi:hypothetical protein
MYTDCNTDLGTCWHILVRVSNMQGGEVLRDKQKHWCSDSDTPLPCALTPFERLAVGAAAAAAAAAFDN